MTLDPPSISSFALVTGSTFVVVPALATAVAIAATQYCHLFVMPLNPAAPLCVGICAFAQSFFGNGLCTAMEADKHCGLPVGIVISQLASGLTVFSLTFLAFKVGLIAASISFTAALMTFGSAMVVSALGCYILNSVIERVK